MVRVPEISEIKKIRKELGLSQRQLAKRCKIQPSYLNMIENNPDKKPSYEVISNIFKILEEESQKRFDQLTTAGKICAKPVLTARKTDYVEDIVKIMSKRDISQVPVMDSKACIGLVTENSFVKYLKEFGKEKLVMAKVKDALETPPPIVDVNERVTNNLLVLLNDSRCILVTENGRLYGIITKMDALRRLMKN
jgi:predicted transcriptional regulator